MHIGYEGWVTINPQAVLVEACPLRSAQCTSSMHGQVGNRHLLAMHVAHTGTECSTTSQESPCLALIVDRRGTSTRRGAAARGLEVAPRLGVRWDVRALRGAAVSISTGSLRRGAVRVTKTLTEDGAWRAKYEQGSHHAPGDIVDHQ